MNTEGFSITLDLHESPQEVYHAVLDVRGWWSENVVGDTTSVGAEWDYAYQDVHDCRIRLTEAVPGERVEWLVLQNRFSFTQNPAEWVGTTMVFEIQPADGGSTLTFTHVGLVEDHECYGVCVQGWDFYIGTSLRERVETGVGRPSTFDHRTKDESAHVGGATATRGYSTALVLCATPEAVHGAVANPRGWWGELVEGSTEVGGEFTFEVPGVHWSRLRVAEDSPTRVVWDVVDARIEYVEDREEWVGTSIVFELEAVPEGTRLSFAHNGLLPELACYDSCSVAWSSLVHDSLRGLVIEGRGAPYAAEPVAG